METKQLLTQAIQVIISEFTKKQDLIFQIGLDDFLGDVCTESDKRGLLTHFIVLQYTGKCNQSTGKKIFIIYIHPHCISY